MKPVILWHRQYFDDGRVRVTYHELRTEPDATAAEPAQAAPAPPEPPSSRRGVRAEQGQLF